jgi:WD40 repeat protein
MTAERQRRRRRRRIAVTTLVTVLLGGLLVVSALWRESVLAKGVAEQEARRAKASQLFALARAELDRDPTAGLAYARKSLELFDAPEVRLFVLDLLWRGPVARILTPEALGDDTRIGGFDASPDSSWFAVLDSENRSAYLVPSDGGSPLVLSVPPEEEISQLAFGPHGDLLVTGVGDATSLRVLSLPDLRELRTIDLDGVARETFVQGDELFTVTSSTLEDPERIVRAWRLPGGEPRRVARFDPTGLTEWAVDPEYRWIAHVRDRTIYLRPTDGARQVPKRVLGRLQDELWKSDSIRVSRSGRALVTLENSGDVTLWPLAGDRSDPSRVFRGEQSSWLLAVDEGPSRVARAGTGGIHVRTLSDPPDAEPLVLRELDTKAGMCSGGFDPSGHWLVAFNGSWMRFWPVTWPRRLRLPQGEGDRSVWGLEFTPDGRWLASCPIDLPARLWPMSARDGSFRDLVPAASCWGIAVHPASTQLLVGTWMDRRRGTLDGRVLLYPLDGGPPRRLPTGWEGRTGVSSLAIDPEGRRAIAAPFPDESSGNPSRYALKEWELDSGDERSFPVTLDDQQWALLRYAPDGSVVCSDTRGIVRMRRPIRPGDPPAVEVLFPSDGKDTSFALSRDGRQLLVLATRGTYPPAYDELILVDLATRATRRITSHGSQVSTAAFDPSGRILVTGGYDGIVRVGPVTGEELHLLVGHSGRIESVAVSPDGRWIASSGGNQLLLWPVPDLTRPPLHALPHDELMARLDALTNLRVVPDASTLSGWKLDVGPFPGWKDVPGW